MKLFKYFLDITTDGALLKEMRSLSGQEKALPPQIFHSDDYLGVCYFLRIFGLLLIF